MLILLTIFFIFNFLFLFIERIFIIRILLLGFSFIFFNCNLYFLIKYIKYNYYFDGLFYIIYKKDLFLFNQIYLLYDGISLSFIFLISILYIISIIIIWNQTQLNLLGFLLNLIIVSLILIFLIYDLLIFYFLFETLLIPMLIIIIIWGSRERKIIAAYKFFFFTFLGSIGFFIGIFELYKEYQSFNIWFLLIYNFIELNNILYIKILWFLFFLAFAVKIPLYPFHTWLPEAHTEAPTVGSILLAGILLKLGPYGLIRFVNFLFFEGAIYYRPLIYLMCLLGIYYTSLIALRQIDIKKIIAYSSIGHMAYVILGIFTFTYEGLLGALFLMISHGFISSGLFFLIGCLYDRYKTRLLIYYGAFAQININFSFFMFLFLLGNIAFPFTLNFLAELLIFLSLIQVNIYISILVIFSSIFVLTYNLLLYMRIFFGTFSPNTKNLIILDLSLREKSGLFLLIFPIFLWGCNSSFLVFLLQKSIYFYLYYKVNFIFI